LLNERFRRLDFNLARQDSRGNGRRDLQNAVQVLGSQLLDIHPFAQYECPFKQTIGDFPLKEFSFFRLVSEFSLASDRENISLCLDLEDSGGVR
jgi:hypothetical protein